MCQNPSDFLLLFARESDFLAGRQIGKGLSGSKGLRFRVLDGFRTLNPKPNRVEGFGKLGRETAARSSC